jgi:hypothetical protein
MAGGDGEESAEVAAVRVGAEHRQQLPVELQPRGQPRAEDTVARRSEQKVQNAGGPRRTAVALVRGRDSAPHAVAMQQAGGGGGSCKKCRL